MKTTSVIPAAAIGSMLEGYCGEFVALAASLAQTLEQASMRGVSLERNRQSLRRVERGMRDLAEEIDAVLARAVLDTDPLSTTGELSPEPDPAQPLQPASEEPPDVDAAEEADISGKCIIQGSTDSLPLASVFQFLGRTRKTGALRVRAGDEVLTFLFVNGRVDSCRSNRPQRSDRLGDVLVELGFADWADIEPLSATGRPLGEELVRARILTNDQLAEALRLQMQRRFDRISAMGKAGYAFHEGTGGARDGQVSVSAASLRMSSSRRPQLRA